MHMDGLYVRTCHFLYLNNAGNSVIKRLKTGYRLLKKQLFDRSSLGLLNMSFGVSYRHCIAAIESLRMLTFSFKMTSGSFEMLNTGTGCHTQT